MDVDICGPSQPKVFGLEGEPVSQSGSGWSPVVCLISALLRVYLSSLTLAIVL